MYEEVIGKVVMVRTYSAGVHYGVLKKVKLESNGVNVALTNTRRVYSWVGACSLSQLAHEGSKNAEKCNISITIPLIYLTAIEVILMSDAAVKNLDASLWKL